ncbi:MAG: ATP synthase F1 subunit delta [Saprospiraceae bacterium]|nr:ATP synthase F1 subunit delta [Saprospiraceae bacterium]
MSISRISQRYAKSLIDLALERNELEAILADIKGFNNVLKNRDFKLLLKSPIINTDKKLNVFKALFEGKINKTTAAFFDIIIKKGREMYLEDITTDFISQYKTLKNITPVRLTTATVLNDSTLAEIRSKLQNTQFAKGNIELTTEVNPELIGGFVIESGDQLYDASILHKLEQLKKDFKKQTN